MTFALAFPTIDPVAVEIGPVAIRWYALAYVLGLVIGWQYVRYLAGAASTGLPGATPTTCVVFVHPWRACVGGRLGYVLFYPPGYYFSNPSEIFGDLAGRDVLSRRAALGVLVRRGPLHPHHEN